MKDSFTAPPPPKKSNTIRNIFIGCGLLVILLVCCVALVLVGYNFREAIPGLPSFIDDWGNIDRGEYIAYVSYSGENGDIFIIRPDGTEETQLTTSPANETDPDWSPEGSRIAFVSDEDGNDEIFIMDSDGGNRVQLTFTSGDIQNSSPDWSPDGTQIAFSSDQDGITGIYIMNVDGSGGTRLTPDSILCLNPAWSPDGSRIAFDTIVEFTETRIDFDIKVIEIATRSISTLASSPGMDWFPAWSPDGAMIAYETNNYGSSFSDFDIVTMFTSGSEVTWLASNASANDSFVAWSRDGQQIAFVSDRDGDFEIFVATLDGSEIQQLTMNSQSDGAPDWQP